MKRDAIFDLTLNTVNQDIVGQPRVKWDAIFDLTLITVNQDSVEQPRVKRDAIFAHVSTICESSILCEVGFVLLK